MWRCEPDPRVSSSSAVGDISDTMVLYFILNMVFMVAVCYNSSSLSSPFQTRYLFPQAQHEIGKIQKRR